MPSKTRSTVVFDAVGEWVSTDEWEKHQAAENAAKDYVAVSAWMRRRQHGRKAGYSVEDLAIDTATFYAGLMHSLVRLILVGAIRITDLRRE